MIREKIYTVLNDALGSTVNAIRPLVLKQKDELPAITYDVEIDHDVTFEGNTSFKKATLEINIFTNSLVDATGINRSLKTAVATVAGVYTGITIFNIYIVREIELFESEEREYRINTQFIVNYSEY